MNKKALLPLFLGLMVFLAGCDYSKPGARSGFSIIRSLINETLITVVG